MSPAPEERKRSPARVEKGCLFVTNQLAWEFRSEGRGKKREGRKGKRRQEREEKAGKGREEGGEGRTPDLYRLFASCTVLYPLALPALPALPTPVRPEPRPNPSLRIVCRNLAPVPPFALLALMTGIERDIFLHCCCCTAVFVPDAVLVVEVWRENVDRRVRLGISDFGILAAQLCSALSVPQRSLTLVDLS
ncbi:hypothetical protein BKA65DRAFT_507666 [Rhexocercosporidium sp. MPI-PUGE-AT-0058]|nr:hypothetical protein BKA65DRAFT_507666 [Rhexocercosporidium sp. MPI-PUGE-AT-0058]